MIATIDGWIDLIWIDGYGIGFYARLSILSKRMNLLPMDQYYWCSARPIVSIPIHRRLCPAMGTREKERRWTWILTAFILGSWTVQKAWMVEDPARIRQDLTYLYYKLLIFFRWEGATLHVTLPKLGNRSDEAMKRYDEALNASSLQFLCQW